MTREQLRKTLAQNPIQVGGAHNEPRPFKAIAEIDGVTIKGVGESPVSALKDAIRQIHREVEA